MNLFAKWQEKIKMDPEKAIEEFVGSLSPVQHVALYELMNTKENELFDYLGNTF